MSCQGESVASVATVSSAADEPVYRLLLQLLPVCEAVVH